MPRRALRIGPHVISVTDVDVLVAAQAVLPFAARYSFLMFNQAKS